MAIWPFTRGRVAWSSGNRITAAIAELWDSQLSQAADGAVWSDVALVTNIANFVTNANGGRCAGWDTTSGRFYSFSLSAGNPVGIASTTGASWRALTVAAGAGLTPAGFSFATSGTIIVMGGTPGSSSNQKFRTSATSDGITWVVRSSSQTTTAGVTTIAWIPQLSLFIAGHSDGVVETSPDGITWTNQPVPNSDARGRIATDGTTVVITSSATAKTITSTNGTSWTEHSSTGLPGGAAELIWSDAQELFLCAASATTNESIYSSPDGVTWSFVSSPTTTLAILRLAESGRVLLGAWDNKYKYSLDGGATWVAAEEIISSGGVTSPRALVLSSKGQALITNTDGDHFATLRGGY